MASNATLGYKKKHFDRRKLANLHVGDQKCMKIIDRLPETVLSGFEALWRQGLLCDATIITERKDFRAHSLVLSACSDYFYDQFVEKRQLDIKECILTSIDADIFAIILESMYTGNVNLTEGVVRIVLQESTNLGYFLIHEACEQFLIETTDMKNCLDILGIANKFSLNKLADAALQIVAKNFKFMSKRETFKELPVDQVVALYKRDDLAITNELDVFHSMVSWICHNKQERIAYAVDLLSTVRLCLLSPASVVDNVESVTFLMDIPDCQRLVKDALHYHCIPARQTVLQSPRSQPRNKAARQYVLTIGGAPRYKSQTISDQVKSLDGSTREWQEVTQLPEARHHHSVNVLEGFLYVAGGERDHDNHSTQNSVFRYDPRQNSWISVAPMLKARQSFQLVALDKSLFAIGGRSGEFESLDSVEKYSPFDNTWTEVAPLSSPRRCIAAAVLNGRIYVVGGSGARTISGKVECYFPTKNKWKPKKPIAYPRFFAQLVPTSNALLLLGGASLDDMGNLACVPAIEKYIPSTDTWVTIATMPSPRAEFGCSMLNNRVYVAGGYDWTVEKRNATVDVFDTEHHRWLPELSCSLPEPVTGIAACVLTIYDNAVRQKS